MDILEDLITKNFLYCYSDDLLIVNFGTLYEHALLILEIIKRFYSNGIKISLNKCIFGSDHFTYLGFRFSPDGIYLTNERVQALVNISVPKSKKAVMSYLGCLNYISYWYPGLSLDTYPISDLLGSDDFLWTEECQKAYERIRSTLNSNLKLNYYDPRKELYAFCDASNRAGACVCFQRNDNYVSKRKARSEIINNNNNKTLESDQLSILDEMEKKYPNNPKYIPILFISRKFNKSNSLLYSALEMEILNIIFSLYKLSFLIDTCGSLTIFSDAKAALYLIKSCQLSNNARLSRLATKLSLFPIKFKIHYTSPKISGLRFADLLSRQYDDALHLKSMPTRIYRQIGHDDINHELKGSYTFEELFNELEKNPDIIKLPPELQKCPPMKFEETGISLLQNESFVHEIGAPLHENDIEKFSPLSANVFLSKFNIIKSQYEDQSLQPIIQLLSLETPDEKIKLEDSLLIKDFILKEGVLCKLKTRKEALINPSANFLIVIPDKLLPTLIGTYHILFGHYGPERIHNVLKERYLNKHLRSKVFDMLSKCQGCQVSKAKRIRKDLISPALRSMAPMDLFSMDFFNMYPSNGYQKILIIVDIYSLFAWGFKTRNEKEKSVISSLDTLFSCVGTPIAIKSDNGPSLLRSKSVAAYLRYMGVQNLYLSLPNAKLHNSVCERIISSLRNIFRSLEHAEMGQWPKLLPRVLNIYNSMGRTYNGGTIITPFEKFFLRKGNTFTTVPDSLVPASYRITKKENDRIVDLVNKHHHNLKIDYANAHNDKAGKPNRINAGDFVYLKRLGTPQAGARNLKTQDPFINRLFLVKLVRGTKVIIEDLSTGIDQEVFIDNLKKHIPREKYFHDLPSEIKDQMGSEFQIDLRLDTRKAIIHKLISAGFDISKNANWYDQDQDVLQRQIDNNSKHTKTLTIRDEDNRNTLDDKSSLNLIDDKSTKINPPGEIDDEINLSYNNNRENDSLFSDKNDINNKQNVEKSEVAESEIKEGISESSISSASSEDHDMTKSDPKSQEIGKTNKSINLESKKSLKSVKRDNLSMSKRIKNKVSIPPLKMKLRSRK